MRASSGRDEKTVLQERAQAEFGITPRYAEVGREGPDHDRVWHFEVRVGEVVAAQGGGPPVRRPRGGGEASSSSLDSLR